MIKKETILSVFDKKLTLLQYLKEIKKAIKDSIVESFSCDQIDTTHVKFSLNFADGTTYETDAIELPTGPQGATPQIEVSASAETLAPNESATASVTQGGTAEAPTFAFAFGIPQGAPAENTKMYLHSILIEEGDTKAKLTLYSFSNTPITLNDLISFCYANGMTTTVTGLSCQGYTLYQSRYFIGICLRCDDNATLKYAAANNQGFRIVTFTSAATTTDVVVEL